MSHVLHISRPDGWTTDTHDDNEWEFRIDCDSKGCDLWIECPGGVHLLHPEDRYDYTHGDTVTEHGVPHQYLDGGGWCVPTPGCAYQLNGLDCDSPFEIADEHGVGSYYVELDWDGDWGHACLVVNGGAA